MLLSFAPCEAVAQFSGPRNVGQELGVRIAWGGGAERRWVGEVYVSNGTLRNLAPLGVEADEPGSMWLEGGRVQIRQPSLRTYDGLDLKVNAPLDAQLVVSLKAVDDPARCEVLTVTLRELLDGYRNVALDERQNRLLVRRSPGDELRVSLSQDTAIYSTGQRAGVRLLPHLLPVKDETQVRFSLKLISTQSGEEVWSQEQQQTLTAPESQRPEEMNFQVPMPEAAGVYNLKIEALTAGGLDPLPRGLRTRIGLRDTLAERIVQFMVTSSTAAAPPINDDAWATQVEIDPANPAWWKRFTNIPIPGLRSQPLGSGDAQLRDHALGKLTQLAASSKDDVSWEAYQLPISRPGRPHILEVTYPSDVPQTLGVSIVEPNASGSVMPIGLDSGVYVQVQREEGSPQWRKHRLIFWPRTKAPLVLLTNRRTDAPAMYGKLRVLDGPLNLSRRFSTDSETDLPPNGRALTAYFDKPLLPEQFSTPQAVDDWSGRSLDDWTTFWQSGNRLTEYLHHVGYSGAMVTVLADGSTIYPSDYLQPTSRYDTGSFFADARDPFRKDVLELLLRQFDQSGLQLTPALDFSGTLPELEAILRDGGPASVGVRWIGPDGASWLQHNRPRRGLAPYYNTLNPRVQAAMLRVVREAVRRYGAHPSMQGLAVHLSADGYAQLAPPHWGLDDETVARFSRETGIQVPGRGAERFGQRAQFLLGPQRVAWLTWRAGVLRNFYLAMLRELRTARPDATLYLTTGKMLDRPEVATRLRPNLAGDVRLQDVLLELGVSGDLVQSTPGIVVTSPHRAGPLKPLGRSALQLQVEHSGDVEMFFSGLQKASSMRAAQFYHAPHEARLQQFDSSGVFPGSFTWLVAQLSPQGDSARRRLVQAICQGDVNQMIDGGWLLTLGQEEELADLIEVYRRLPSERFETVAGSSQRVVVRTLSWRDRTYVYFANTLPWPVQIETQVNLPPRSQMETLSAESSSALRLNPMSNTVTVDLAPMQLVGAWFSAPRVAVTQPRIQHDPEAESELNGKLQDLFARAAALRDPPKLAGPTNADFESSATETSPIPGWVVTASPGVSAELDSTTPHGGRNSVRLSSTGPAVTLASEPLEAPDTGRLVVKLAVRVADAMQQPPLRVAVEGRLDGQTYYRYAPLGQGPQVPQIGTAWSQYEFPLDELPLDGLTDVRVRIDLMGAGQVWIDDIQVGHLEFTQRERFALTKLISIAKVTLQRGELGDCLHLLEGYWPRFLLEHVPPQPESQPKIQSAQAANSARQQVPPKTARQNGFLDRMRGYVPSWMRF